MKKYFWEVIAPLGSVICLVIGIVFIGVSSKPCWIYIGVTLVTIAWGLAWELGLTIGKRKGRLEERIKREKDEPN